MKNSFLLILLFSTAQIFAQSVDVSIPFDNFQYQIKGTFLKAEKPNGTAVMIIAGSGPTDRDCNNPQMKSNSYKFLGEHFAKNGISSLRYDKLGVAASTPGKDEQDLLFTDNVSVAATVYDFLSQQSGVERIVILGHSEGSLVGMLLAQQVDAYKYISLAGPAYSADALLKRQLGTLPDSLKTEAFAMLDTLKMGKALTHYNAQLMSLFRPSLNNYLIDWFKYNPQEEIAKLEMPVLVIQGDNDIQVSNDNPKKLAEANKKAKLVMIKDVNHILKKAPRDFNANYETYNSPLVDIDKVLKKAIADFITH
jgi:pimeloyl-ACP methyl ester carboxylesterase